MIVSFFTFYLIVLFYWTKANSFVFEDGGRRFRLPFRQDSSASQRRLGSHFSSTTISNVLNIPTTLIRTTSTAAQTFAPDNADKIEKVFDIPVQTLQAIGNFVKDMTPPSVDRQRFNNQQGERLGLMKKHHQQQQLQQQEQQQKILSLQNQQKQNDERISQRHAFGRFGWASALTDLFFGGHKNLFGNDRFIFGGGGDRQGHKKKRKRNKHGLFGGHGQGNNADDEPSFNNDKDIYQVYNDINILPNGLFTWNPTRKFDRIQNKIAPGFDDESQTTH